jgi:carbamoyl-phosphate synthase small subunit
MFSSLAARLPSTLGHAAPRVPLRLSGQARLLSRLAVDGSKGRAMPFPDTRATAAASGVDATLTIRVCSHIRHMALDPPHPLPR